MGHDFSWVIGPAVTAAIVAGLVSVIQVYVTGRRDRNKLTLEFRLQRLNELYAPIVLLLAENLEFGKTLREAFGAPPPSKGDWHLLNNIPRVTTTPALMGLAEQIVDVNNRIRAILEAKAGLALAGDLPPSFHRFLAHADLVKHAVEGGTVPPDTTLKYFPIDFETDIHTSYRSLVEQIRKGLKEK